METLAVLNDMNDPFCTGGNGLAADDQGNLWVTDGMNGEVRVYDETRTLVQTYELDNPGPIVVSGAYTGIETGFQPHRPGISVTPNPAASLITIAGPACGAAVGIFDLAGRMAAESAVGADGTAVIDVTNLRPGIYSAVGSSSAVRFTVTAR